MKHTVLPAILALGISSCCPIFNIGCEDVIEEAPYVPRQVGKLEVWESNSPVKDYDVLQWEYIPPSIQAENGQWITPTMQGYVEKKAIERAKELGADGIYLKRKMINQQFRNSNSFRWTANIFKYKEI